MERSLPPARISDSISDRHHASCVEALEFSWSSPCSLGSILGTSLVTTRIYLLQAPAAFKTMCTSSTAASLPYAGIEVSRRMLLAALKVSAIYDDMQDRCLNTTFRQTKYLQDYRIRYVEDRIDVVVTTCSEGWQRFRAHPINASIRVVGMAMQHSAPVALPAASSVAVSNLGDSTYANVQ